MVFSLGPGKFYGSSLPRPRIYTDTKFNFERVDPPVPVLDPLLSWANEAHWSMGGLSFTRLRLRLQGRIEGNVKRLKAQREKLLKNSPDKNFIVKNNKRDASLSPPPAPLAVKKRKVLDLNNDDQEEEEAGSENEVVVENKQKGVMKKGTARKLGDDFERVAKDSGMRKIESTSSNGNGGDVMKTVEEVNFFGSELEERKKKKERILKNSNGEVVSGIRSSPRLAKRS